MDCAWLRLQNLLVPSGKLMLMIAARLFYVFVLRWGWPYRTCIIKKMIIYMSTQQLILEARTKTHAQMDGPFLCHQNDRSCCYETGSAQAHALP